MMECKKDPSLLLIHFLLLKTTQWNLTKAGHAYKDIDLTYKACETETRIASKVQDREALLNLLTKIKIG